MLYTDASQLAESFDKSNHGVGSRAVDLMTRSTEAAANGMKASEIALLVPLGIMNALVWIPVLIFLLYTLGDIFPVLAIVEDPSSTKYDRVPLEDRQGGNGSFKLDVIDVDGDADADAPKARPVTSSLRDTYRLLKSIAGRKSVLRGFGCFLVLNLANIFLGATMGLLPFIPRFVTEIVPPVMTVQLHTCWTHIVMTAPSDKPFWCRVPGFRTTFRATALPTFLFFTATLISRRVPYFLLCALAVETPTPFAFSMPGTAIPVVGDVAKMAVIMALCLVLIASLVTPTLGVLTRIQASMLPIDDEPIVPFQRMSHFDETGGNYMSMRDAWESFTGQAWLRLVKLYVKVFFISTAAYIFFAFVISQEAALVGLQISTGRGQKGI